jgi:putative heme-binding domain-containing protein
VQSATLDTLATFDSPAVAAMLTARWPSLSPSVRRQAGDVLFSRPQWVAVLLEQIRENKIRTADLEPGRLQLLASHADPSVRQLAADVLKGQSQASDRDEVVRQFQASLHMPGDRQRGKDVFQKSCAGCHRVEGVGYEIGPNLATVRNRGVEAILLNVLHPNREVNPQYLNYIVVTTDGRTLTGMIAGESATSIMLRRADNKSDTVLRVDIDELHSTGLSLMPEGVEKEIDTQAMADLLEYLRSLE